MWRGGSRWEAAGSSFIIKAHSQLDGANATRTLESASEKQARREEDEEESSVLTCLLSSGALRKSALMTAMVYVWMS